MKIKLDNRTGIALAAIVLLAAGFFFAAESFSFGAASDIDYFKGKWTVTMKDNPQQTFVWTVKDDLQGAWLAGAVEKNGERVSTDFWRLNGGKIERFAFTSGGLFVHIESAGWQSNILVMTGTASDKTGETKIRETITKTGSQQFRALWESQSADGKWTTFADEICTK